MKSQISDSLGADISFRACAKVIRSDLTHFTQISSTIARASGERRGKISSIFDKASMGHRTEPVPSSFFNDRHPGRCINRLTVQ
jgi:hypothetical protein